MIGRTINAQLAAAHYNAAALKAAAGYGREVAIKAYGFLRGKVESDFAFLAARVSVLYVKDDPYADLAELRADLIQGRIRVFMGSLDHPFFTPEENLKFRAVHDYFGHALPSIGFNTFEDERRAFFAHARSFGPGSTFSTSGTWELARAAMAQEVIGQAGFFYSQGRFPQQAIGLFPYGVFHE